jgi:hypothetical protein
MGLFDLEFLPRFTGDDIAPPRDGKPHRYALRPNNLVPEKQGDRIWVASEGAAIAETVAEIKIEENRKLYKFSPDDPRLARSPYYEAQDLRPIGAEGFSATPLTLA